ncbi:MAG TPA: metalloregulator ArsR/SmtB family transcription factor [Chthoniobacterales bacterium]|nr:metalloregulator ArsR/SmtB family transcription factor [Chthoniobacterales bacterium]
MHGLDAAFSAVADPTRRAILARLAQGEATVNELAEPFEMTQPAISQHLKVLEDAGLIVRRVEGTKRPRRLSNTGIEAMDQWLAMLRNALETNYNRLDEVLEGMEKPEMKKTIKEKNDEQDDAEDRRRYPVDCDKALHRAPRSGVPRPYRSKINPEMAAWTERMDDARMHQ